MCTLSLQCGRKVNLLAIAMPVGDLILAVSVFTSISPIKDDSASFKL